MNWSYGLRKGRDGGWIITEELGRYGYADIGQIEPGYSKKEIGMMCEDILQAVKKRTKYEKLK